MINTSAAHDYVLVHAFEAMSLYSAFKQILNEMISNPTKYLPT